METRHRGGTMYDGAQFLAETAAACCVPGAASGRGRRLRSFVPTLLLRCCVWFKSLIFICTIQSQSLCHITSPSNLHGRAEPVKGKVKALTFSSAELR